jgi:rubrerythrin
MYPVFLRVAEQQGEDGAIESFHWALSAERTHVQLFSDAQKAVDREEDMDLDPVQVCDVCGYTIEGEAPDECPICQRGSEVFETFA